VTEPAITPLQVREARRLLRWPRERLAVRMGINHQTIARFENEGRYSWAFDPRKAREFLESAGVEFVEESGGGAGVRLRKQPVDKD
jgi:transcriptional regulator with XRE-family HTH domain